jgi:hypothetical protein
VAHTADELVLNPQTLRPGQELIVARRVGEVLCSRPISQE